MGDELISQIARDVRDTKHELGHVTSKVDEMHRMLFVEGPAGKPPVHERLSALETKSRMADWLAGTIVGGGILAIIGLIASSLHIGGSK